MKNHYRRLLLLPLAGLLIFVGILANILPASHASATNLVINSGFETGTTANWNCSANDSITASPVHSGAYALQIAPSASDTAQCQQTINVQPNQTYYLQAYVAGNYAYIGVNGYGNNWTNSGSYTQLSYTFTTSSSTSNVTIYVHGWYAQGNVYADDFSLTSSAQPTPTPTTQATGTPTPTPKATATPTPAPTSTPMPTPTPTSTPVPPAGGGRVIAYYTQWSVYGRNYLIKNIDTSGSAAKLTTLNYAFANISSSLQCTSGDSYADSQKTFTAAQAVNGVADTWNQPLAGNFNQLKELKAKYPNLKILISIGGWTWSTNFSAAAAPQNVAGFVNSCIDQYITGNQGGAGVLANIFDGFDIDWEYPNNAGVGNPHGPQDTQNYTNMLQQFRSQLDSAGAKNGKHYLLTVAAPSGQDKYQNIQLKPVSQAVDWIDIMAYDMHGAWDATGPTDFNAPLYASPNDPSAAPANSYSLDRAVSDYLAAGVPPNKIVVGMPIYGHGWTGVPNSNNGLYQSSSSMSAAPGTYEAGTEDYKVLKNLSGYTGYRDPITQAYWIFNGSTFWSYDDLTTVATKMNYIKGKGLGGAFAWALDGDDGSGSFMNAIYQGLK